MFSGESKFEDRDRRWKAIRNMMKKHDLDCLILPGASGFGTNYAQYVSNQGRVAVVFPIEGEPTIFNIGWTSLMRIRERLRLGAKMWISDHRAGADLGTDIVARIKDLGYSEGKIGVTGLEGGLGAGNVTEGWMPYKTMTNIEKGLPNARFEDVSARMVEIILVKTPEELKLVEKAAEIGEHACEVMLSVTKPGVTAREIRYEANESIYCAGAPHPGIRGIIEGIEGVVRNRDVINTEWFVDVGSMTAVMQMCMAVGKVSEKTERDAEIAEACLNKGIEVLRPGVKFGDVIAAMEKVVTDAGAWHWYPLLVSRNPQVLRGGEGTPHMLEGVKSVLRLPEASHPSMVVLGPDVVVKSGMTFSFEPAASTGDFAFPFSYVKVGCHAIVTNTGCRVLNILGTKLQRV